MSERHFRLIPHGHALTLIFKILVGIIQERYWIRGLLKYNMQDAHHEFLTEPPWHKWEKVSPIISFRYLNNQLIIDMKLTDKS